MLEAMTTKLAAALEPNYPIFSDPPGGFMFRT